MRANPDFRIFVFFMIVSLAASLFTGCEKKVFFPQSEQPAAPEQQEEEPETIHWSPENGYIFIIFGYGFNSQEFYADVIAQLSQKYGLEETGGIIVPVTYPDTVKGRISNIYEIITAHKVKGVILLGAPENTHRTLARLRDDWNRPSETSAKDDAAGAAEPAITQETQESLPQPYPIFSFMPQDDILGQESNCDFVLEYERSSNIEEEETQETKKIDKTVEQLLIRSVRYMEELSSPLAADDKLHSHVQTIVGERKVHRYTDSATGLQAINHFVLEQEQTQEPQEEN